MRSFLYSTILALVLASPARAQLSGPILLDQTGAIIATQAPYWQWTGGGISCVYVTGAKPTDKCTIPAGAGGNLQNAYDNGGAGITTVVLDSTRLGIAIRDNAAPVGGTLFGVQSTGGTSKYLDVTATTIGLTPPGALTLTGGAASTLTTTAGAQTIDSFATLNLGTATATSIAIGSAGITTAVTGSTTITGSVTQSGGNVNLTSSGAAFYQSARPDAVNAISTVVNATANYATSGATILAVRDNSSVTGELRIGVISQGTASVFAYAEDLTCSGTVTAGQVVVWTGTNAVAAAAATANLTAIAGVAITGGTNATIIVARSGRVLVNSDAGITVGQIVSTSGAVGGNVVFSSTTGAGAIVGRACEATGATVANKITIDLILG